jgi:formylglycine-generating enzyme required for sulfatase activity
VTILLTKVANLGNKADTTVMVTDTTTGYGSVAYAYSIGVEDVTLTQYTAFLNAVAKSDPNGLYNTDLGSFAHVKGIARTGASGSYVYSVIGNGQNPVTYVSWLDAARFCNWLENGQPTGNQGPGTTETGSYTLSANTGLETKNAGARWWIPSENEWYKAAYYDPTKGGTGGYWSYPTRSGTTPGNDYLTPDVANQANFINAKGQFSVTQSSTEVSTQNYLTPVRSFLRSPSYYGTYDQGGDVYQWNDAIIGKSRGVRGGSWDLNSTYLESSARDSRSPTGEQPGVGFRVASSLPPAPIVTSTLSATGTDGEAFKYQIAASNAASFAVKNPPPGVSNFVASTGVISGTPTQSGTFDTIVSGINESGTGSATVVIVVKAAAVAGGADGATIVTATPPPNSGTLSLSGGGTVASGGGVTTVSDSGGTLTLNGSTLGSGSVVLSAGDAGGTISAGGYEGTGSGTIFTSGTPGSISGLGGVEVVSGPYSGPQGSFRELVAGSSAGGPVVANVGLLSIYMGPEGGYSGKLTLSGSSYTFSGKISDYSGMYETTATPNPNSVSFIIEPPSGGIALVNTSAGLSVYNFFFSPLGTAATLPAGLAGEYAVGIPADAASGVGAGRGKMSVGEAGVVQIRGVLGDGTPFTAAGQLNADGKTCALFTSLSYGATQGSLAGTITFAPSATYGYQATGPLEWIIPPGADTLFPNGTSLSVELHAVK